MDFFENQERAKRNTTWLVALFVIGVVVTIASVHLLVAGFLGGGNFSDLRMLALSSGSVFTVVGIGTAVKFAQMSHGGRAVAEAMGGNQINPASGDTDERRVLNVVEEMAIASGMPVPPVYLLEEDSINAFAAGNSPSDAVIGVTRGCIHALNRDELQGVMAHEFSHIFHQDTRLNMRLVAWLGGIVALSTIGRVLLRSQMYARSSRNSKNNGAAVAIGIGVGLFLIGIVGYFFGRIIQAAVSRQREYLADASAVQYTRNPDGIAGALEKIGRAAGSKISAPAAAEFSHFFFASSVASLFSTHPPIEERIARIRGLRMVEAGVTAAGTVPSRLPPEATAGPSRHTTGLVAGLGQADTVSASAVRAARRGMGTLSPSEIAGASAVIASISQPVLDAARDPFSARAVVCLLLLSVDRAERTRQINVIAQCDRMLAETTLTLARAGEITPAQRLPLLEACAAALTLLSPAQYAGFRTTLAQLIAADGQVDRTEWTVRVVLRHVVEGRGAPPINDRRADKNDQALVVSVLAWSGAKNEEAAKRAWNAAQISKTSPLEQIVPANRCTLDALDLSLRAYAGSGVAAKKQLMDACVASVLADGVTTLEEGELLRAISASIGVPMPLLLTN